MRQITVNKVDITLQQIAWDRSRGDVIMFYKYPGLPMWGEREPGSLMPPDQIEKMPHRVIEVSRGIHEPPRWYAVPVDDRGVFAEMLCCADKTVEDWAKKIAADEVSNKLFTERINTRTETIERIKNLPWWKRLLKQF